MMGERAEKGRGERSDQDGGEKEVEDVPAQKRT